MTPAKPKPIVLPELTWRASPNVSSRNGADVHLVVVHRPVGTYAGSVAYLCTTAAQASAHIVMAPGGKVATQLVGWEDKAWACVSFNSMSDNLEIADEVWVGEFVKGKFVSGDPRGWQTAARIVAFRCKKRGIPPTWTRNPHTTPGVTRHFDLGIAGGGHTDPTTDERIWRAFMAEVKRQYDRGGFRPVWGRP